MTFLSHARQPEMSLFSLLICLKATKFVLQFFFTLIQTTCPNVCLQSRLKSAEPPLPVDECRLKALPLKLPVIPYATCIPKALGKS